MCAEPGTAAAQHLLQNCGSGGLSDSQPLPSAYKLPARALQPEIGGTKLHWEAQIWPRTHHSPGCVSRRSFGTKEHVTKGMFITCCAQTRTKGPGHVRRQTEIDPKDLSQKGAPQTAQHHRDPLPAGCPHSRDRVCPSPGGSSKQSAEKSALAHRASSCP